MDKHNLTDKAPAAEVKKVRQLTGVGMMQLFWGMREAETNDPLIGACYVIASSQAVCIKGPPGVRHERDLRKARAHAKDLREKLENQDA